MAHDEEKKPLVLELTETGRLTLELRHLEAGILYQRSQEEPIVLLVEGEPVAEAKATALEDGHRPSFKRVVLEVRGHIGADA